MIKVISKPFEAYRGNEPFIFVSYAHEDQKEVYSDIEYLHKIGYRIWYDEGIKASEEFRKRIGEAILECSYFTVFLSPEAVKSENVSKEIFMAVGRQKQVLPIFIEPTRLTSDLEYELSPRHALKKYEMSRDGYLQDLEKTLPVSLKQKPITIDSREEDFMREVNFRIKNVHGWSNSLTDDLLKTAQLIGLNVEKARKILDGTLDQLGISEEHTVNIEHIRQLVIHFLRLGDISPERRLILANQAKRLYIPPEQWENIIQDEAVMKARELYQQGNVGAAKRILVSSVGEHMPQSEVVRLLLEELESKQESVDCTVFAPPSATQGKTFFVQVFVHSLKQVKEANKLAVEFDETAQRRAYKTLEKKVAHGTKLMFELIMPGLEIDEPVQSLVWNGRPESVQFGVTIPDSHPPGNVIGTIIVSQNSVPIGHIKFIFKIMIASHKRLSRKMEWVGNSMHRYNKAFVSYASEDRNKVVPRVQMLRPLGIEYFQDILDLDPVDRWEKKLYLNITQCDLFLLFWSSAAKKSVWVRKEVKSALDQKGDDEFAPPEILPIIVEGPPVARPWDELAHLHFNDRLIYFMNN